jgi:hypothetical protein
MAAEPQPPALSDSATEPAIRRLLHRQAQLTDQQAEVQAQLAALLPSKYGPNIKLELLMLRHKLHALRAYAALYGTTSPALDGSLACAPVSCWSPRVRSSSISTLGCLGTNHPIFCSDSSSSLDNQTRLTFEFGV